MLYCRDCGDEVVNPDKIEIRMFLATHDRHDYIKVGFNNDD